MLDLAIVGGEVIDGTGSPRRRADIGIRQGRIVAVGSLDEPAHRRIDASGEVVTPGFIDVHTHYDAQVAWDPHLTPSPLHGVTTVIGGNCGFTLAPMEEEAAEYLVELLARVEGMPLATLKAGVDIAWKTFHGYLDTVEGNTAVNAGFLVGHSTVRRLVLGEDWRRPASDAEVDAMSRLIDESLAAGALGLSSSWSETHNDAAGDPVPSRYATESELLRLCATLRPHPGTWLEFLPWAVGAFPRERCELMARMSAAAERALNWNLLLVRPDITDDAIASRLLASDLAVAEGGCVFGLALPIPQTLYLNLESGFLFDFDPVWADVIAKPHDEKVRMLRLPEVRQRLESAAKASRGIWYDLERLRFERVEAAAFADVQGVPVAEAARRRGASAFDLLFDVVLADDLRTILMVPPIGDDPDSWRRRMELLDDPRTLVGGSDAGAHLDMSDTFSFFTDFVGTTVRERQLLPLETAVRMVTDDAARAFGLRNRGRIEPGYAADVVVFDESLVRSKPIETRDDLPGNGTRLFAEAEGIDWVLVNGEVIAASGELTESRPGTVLRSGRDTETVLARR